MAYLSRNFRPPFAEPFCRSSFAKKKSYFREAFAKLSRTPFEALQWSSFTISFTRGFWSILIWFGGLSGIPIQASYAPLSFVQVHFSLHVFPLSPLWTSLNTCHYIILEVRPYFSHSLRSEWLRHCLHCWRFMAFIAESCLSPTFHPHAPQDFLEKPEKHDKVGSFLTSSSPRSPSNFSGSRPARKLRSACSARWSPSTAPNKSTWPCLGVFRKRSQAPEGISGTFGDLSILFWHSLEWLFRKRKLP